MASRRLDRLQRVARGVAEAPLRTDVLDTAYEDFRATGLLPELDRLAAAVIDRAERSLPGPTHEPVDLASGIQRLVELAHAIEAGDPITDRPERSHHGLLHEALASEIPVRDAARLALRCLAANGVDVTKPFFFDEQIGMPVNGTVGLHVLRVPHLVPPPYLEQARQLLEQAAADDGMVAAYARKHTPRPNRPDPAAGPPVPDTATLIRQAQRLGELATELGLVGAGMAG